jgi:HEPN domain-containing protein
MTQKRIEAFLQIADEEMAAAERLQTPLPKQAEYFLQQTVEKLIRATLEAAEIPAGTAHSLSFLAGMLPQSHKLRLRYMEFEHLSSASTRYRYPSGTGAIFTISAEEVAKDLARVQALRTEVRHFLKSEGFI